MMNKRQQKAVLIGSGENFSLAKLREDMNDNPVLICADGGLNRLKNTPYKPDYILGDFDSAETGLTAHYPDAVIEEYSSEKDDTDMELAIKKAVELGCRELILYGATGDYMDHTLANIFNLFRYGSAKVSLTIRTHNASIFLIRGYWKFLEHQNRRISFIPLTAVKGLIMEGFQYRFRSDCLKAFEYGISNRIDQSPAVIEFQKGTMLAVLYDQNYH